MEQAPVQIGQYILGKNLGIGAFGKVSNVKAGSEKELIPVIGLFQRVCFVQRILQLSYSYVEIS